MEDNILLRNSDTFPSSEVLLNELGNEIFQVFEEMLKIISTDEFGLKLEWNYYNDGKAWLCKVCYKKKTVFWLSIWENHFKTGFYFTEKTRSDIFNLQISETIKQEFELTKTIGKLFPLFLKINNINQLDDLLEIIKYKKSLK